MRPTRSSRPSLFVFLPLLSILALLAILAQGCGSRRASRHSHTGDRALCRAHRRTQQFRCVRHCGTPGDRRNVDG